MSALVGGITICRRSYMKSRGTVVGMYAIGAMPEEGLRIDYDSEDVAFSACDKTKAACSC